MPEENLWELLMAVFREIAKDFIYFMPKIFVALLVLIITLLIIKVLNISLRRLLKLAEVDKVFHRLTGFSIPFNLSNIIILLADVGIALISVYAIVSFSLGAEYVHMMTDVLYYGARIISIVVITLFIFAMFNIVIDKIVMESRLRGYTFFIILLLVTAMLIDITALSESMKNALITGLSIGLGISIGVFAVWFFFHDYIDRILLRKERRELKKSE